MHVSTQMQVEIESDELQQTAEAVAAHPEAMLDLEPQHVVGTEETGLGQQLADQPLEAEEGNYFRSFNFWNYPYSFAALPAHCSPCWYLISDFCKSQFVLCMYVREFGVHIEL